MVPTSPLPPAPLAPPIAPADITGLVLAGGRGARMGGIDKGLQSYHGMPLALHAVLRLQRQVGPVMINANRNLAAYEAMGVPVWPDALADYPGPLAGMLAGLEHCETPWLLTVPCDTPEFPDDLAARLSTAAAAQGADIAMAATREDGELRTQPVFCLINAMLMEDLMAWLQSGQRKIDRWTARHRCATVEFSDAGAFFNANTPDELQRLRQRSQPLG
ncbi:MAG: molybdenum cofactor guanylyltransferase MobA [Rubrivivax sp.]|nr:molybdenum cofactor guanylyltransferase MobA [Rubrivivax sp.]